MNINDGIKIAEAVVSPIEKLITTVSAGIGKVYEPTHIKRISNAIRDNIDIPIVYNDGKVSINSENFQELAQRASSRMAFQELTKQQNIDNIVYNAREELKNIKNVSEEPVDKDWVFRFFNSVENISNEDLQKIWGRILAGEIKTPNSYSYRALEVLKNMAPREIEVFQKVAKISLMIENSYFIPCDKNILNKTGITFDELFLLEGCGILTTRDLTLTYKINNPDKIFIQNDTYISFALPKAGINEFTLDVYVFNQSGNELIKSLTAKKDHEYILDFLKDLGIKNKCKSIDFTAHKISDIKENGDIEYFLENILES